jgi:hypothetical protein
MGEGRDWVAVGEDDDGGTTGRFPLVEGVRDEAGERGLDFEEELRLGE